MPENKDDCLMEKKENCARTLPQEFTLVILAGGASSRMGQEKSDLLLDDRTFLEIQIEKGRLLGAKKILISGYRGVRCTETVIPDRIPGQGPLGGLESCFRRAETEKCLVLGVDTPLVPAEELYELLKFSMEETTKPVTMLSHNGKEESLMAVYESCLYAEMTAFLESGQSSVYRFVNKAGYSVYETVASEDFFQNINDPDTYQKILRKSFIKSS